MVLKRLILYSLFLLLCNNAFCQINTNIDTTNNYSETEIIDYFEAEIICSNKKDSYNRLEYIDTTMQLDSIIGVLIYEISFDTTTFKILDIKLCRVFDKTHNLHIHNKNDIDYFAERFNPIVKQFECWVENDLGRIVVGRRIFGYNFIIKNK